MTAVYEKLEVRFIRCVIAGPRSTRRFTAEPCETLLLTSRLFSSRRRGKLWHGCAQQTCVSPECRTDLVNAINHIGIPLHTSLPFPSSRRTHLSSTLSQAFFKCSSLIIAFIITIFIPFLQVQPTCCFFRATDTCV